MKRCSTCQQTKPLSDFYRNRAMKDGYQNVCKQCSGRYAKRWGSQHIDKVRALGRAQKRRTRAQQSDEANRAEWNEWYQQNAEERRAYPQRQRDAEKQRAHHILAKAIRSGKIVRPNHCVRCLSSCKPDGHHPDYSKPLEVEWLCRRCHRLTQNPPVEGYLQPPPPTKA